MGEKPEASVDPDDSEADTSERAGGDPQDREGDAPDDPGPGAEGPDAGHGDPDVDAVASGSDSGTDAGTADSDASDPGASGSDSDAGADDGSVPAASLYPDSGRPDSLLSDDADAPSPAPDPELTAAEFVAAYPGAATAAASAAEDESSDSTVGVVSAPETTSLHSEPVSPDADEAADDAVKDAETGADDGSDYDVASSLTYLDDPLGSEGPEYDEEMPLTDHIEEMVRRLGIVFAVGIAATLVVFPISDQLINYLWNAHIPGAPAIEGRRPRLYGPLELILTELKVAGLAGFVVGLPVLVYQSYRFMRPGLFPRERRYYLAAVPTSLVLALVGVAFSHFVVLPAIFAYFTAYTEGTAVVAFGLRETFRLILLLMGYMALVFQIPLFIMLATMMNLVTRTWLAEKRLLFWGGFLGASFLISPDPTGMAPIIIAATMIALFEGTLALLRWTGN